MKRKLTSILVSLCMVLTLVPMSLFAVEGEVEEDTLVVENLRGNRILPDENGIIRVTRSDNYRVSGNSTRSRIVVDVRGDVSFSFSNVSIDVSELAVGVPAFSVVNARRLGLIVVGNTNNSFVSGNGCAGININPNTFTIIRGRGILSATGGYEGAGIGGNADQGAVQRLRIDRAVTIIANSGSYGAQMIGHGARWHGEATRSDMDHAGGVFYRKQSPCTIM